MTAELMRADGSGRCDEGPGTRDVGEVELTVDQLERLERVAVRATWRGAEVSVVRTRGDRADLWTRDADLAAREDLSGELREGWQLTVPVSELDDLHEVVVLEKGGD